MKKQILTLMVSTAVFAATPAFGMDEMSVVQEPRAKKSKRINAFLWKGLEEYPYSLPDNLNREELDALVKRLEPSADLSEASLSPAASAILEKDATQSQSGETKPINLSALIHQEEQRELTSIKKLDPFIAAIFSKNVEFSKPWNLGSPKLFIFNSVSDSLIQNEGKNEPLTRNLQSWSPDNFRPKPWHQGVESWIIKSQAEYPKHHVYDTTISHIRSSMKYTRKRISEVEDSPKISQPVYSLTPLGEDLLKRVMEGSSSGFEFDVD